jgi:SAM-dependent methyltransferase
MTNPNITQFEGFRDHGKKKAIRQRFDCLARERDSWQGKNKYYHLDHQRYYRFMVSEGLRVLEIGCGLGDLLAALKPRRGLGIDLSGGMVTEAAKRHPELEFRVGDVETLELDEQFDVIILDNVIGHFVDVEIALRQLKKCCTPKTRLIISYYNFLWEPVLLLGEKLGLKMPQQHQNWLSPKDVINLLNLTEYQAVKVERRLLLPINIPFFSTFFNRFLAYLPGFCSACLCHYVIARPPKAQNGKEYSTTIVIPCRNERGNIETAITRTPRMSRDQEYLFIEGHSTDGTLEEIERVINKYPEKRIRLLVQSGKGKANAVREGFSHANGDILMILDADLTMPPEDLPKFYQAIATGKGEFINGCRLVYPMEKEAMRLLNLVGNKFFSLAFSWLLNQRIKDTLCGTKVLFRDDYHRIEANREYFGDFDPFGDFDLLFGASKLNLKIIEIPIRYQDRQYGTTNIHRWAHGWLLLKMTVYGFFKLKSV